jgi:hypothetical protein
VLLAGGEQISAPARHGQGRETRAGLLCWRCCPTSSSPEQRSAVNFYAHAILALGQRADTPWLIGSMAPDFASMGGLRLQQGAGEEALAAGIEFHHKSDDAFHGAPIFLALMKAARLDLQARGVGTGASMAIGHVGVELLLDGYLALRDGVAQGYRDAVAAAADVATALTFRGDDQKQSRARWRSVCQRLADAPLPERYREPEFVADRLIKILAPRRRLAVDPAKRGEVFAWAEAALPLVEARAEELVAEVEGRLERSP